MPMTSRYDVWHHGGAHRITTALPGEMNYQGSRARLVTHA